MRKWVWDDMRCFIGVSLCVRVRERVRERGRGRWEIVSSLWVDHQSTNYTDGRRCGQVEVSAGVWHILVIVSGLIGQSGIFPWKPLDSYRNRWPKWCGCFFEVTFECVCSWGAGLSRADGNSGEIRSYDYCAMWAGFIISPPPSPLPTSSLIDCSNPHLIQFLNTDSHINCLPPLPCMHVWLTSDHRQCVVLSSADRGRTVERSPPTCRDLQIDHTKTGICHCKILTRFGVLEKTYNR